MELVFYILLFTTVMGFTLLLLENLLKSSTILHGRLNQIKKIANESSLNEYNEPFYKRIIQPAGQKIVSIITSLAPVQIKERYANLIVTAGGKKDVSFSSVFFSQVVMCVAIGGVLYGATRIFYEEARWPYVIVGAVLGFILPVYILYVNSLKRKERIRRELPDFLDLLYISVEAGLGFDLALKRSAEKMRGVFSQEVIKAMLEISRGRNREEAFRGLEKRTGVEEVGSFIIAVIQTERLGSNIANMLRNQSVMMRQKRKQNAEEKAAKMGIKMTFPMVLFIFPSLFVVIMGPAVINIFEQFVMQSR